MACIQLRSRALELRFGGAEVINHLGVSGIHAELRLRGRQFHERPEVLVRDVSANGTGLLEPGAADIRWLNRGEDVPGAQEMTRGAIVERSRTLGQSNASKT